MPATQSPSPALNTEIMAELRDIMGKEFDSLISVFLEDAPQAIQRITELSRSGDVAGIAAPAHTLKSTSANLGALRLSTLARTLEHNSRQGTLTDAPRHAAELASEFSRVAAALKQELANSP